MDVIHFLKADVAKFQPQYLLTRLDPDRTLDGGCGLWVATVSLMTATLVEQGLAGWTDWRNDPHWRRRWCRWWRDGWLRCWSRRGCRDRNRRRAGDRHGRHRLGCPGRPWWYTATERGNQQQRGRNGLGKIWPGNVAASFQLSKPFSHSMPRLVRLSDSGMQSGFAGRTVPAGSGTVIRSPQSARDIMPVA